MGDRAADVLGVLTVGRESSMRGSGISLKDALSNSRYRDLRPTISSGEFVPLLEAHPSIVEDWLAYSEDKRTSGGWYVVRPAQIGQVGDSRSIEHFRTLQEAISEYVLRELDFWVGVVDV
jgi:hypothetical protein